MLDNKLPEIGSRYIFRLKKWQPAGQPVFLDIEAELVNFRPLPKEQEEVAISKKETTIEFDVAKMCVAKEEMKRGLATYKGAIFPRKFYNLAQNLVNSLDPIKEDKHLTATEIENRMSNPDPDSPVAKIFDEFLEPYKNVLEKVLKEYETDMKEESLPKSIWKDVSELKEWRSVWKQLIVRGNGEDRIFQSYSDGVFYQEDADSDHWYVEDGMKYCYLQDFITEHNQTKELAEQNTKDIMEMKLLINK